MAHPLSIYCLRIASALFVPSGCAGAVHEGLEMTQNQNPVKAQPGWPSAVVLGGYYTGVNLVRYLVRRGVTAYCLDNDRNRQAFRSVYGTTLQCPDPDRQPAEWLAFMLDLARKVGGKPVLIPSADAFVSAMARHADELGSAYVFCRDSVALQGILATKRRQYDLAVEHGMPIPRTRFAHSPEEVIEFCTAQNRSSSPGSSASSRKHSNLTGCGKRRA